MKAGFSWKQRGHEFERKQEGEYGKIWMEKRKGKSDVTMLRSQKLKKKIKQNLWKDSVGKKFAFTLMYLPFYIAWCFFLDAFNIFFVCVYMHISFVCTCVKTRVQPWMFFLWWHPLLYKDRIFSRLVKYRRESEWEVKWEGKKYRTGVQSVTDCEQWRWLTIFGPAKTGSCIDL